MEALERLQELLGERNGRPTVDHHNHNDDASANHNDRLPHHDPYDVDDRGSVDNHHRGHDYDDDGGPDDHYDGHPVGSPAIV